MPLVAIGNQWNITTPNQVVAGSIGFDEVGRVNMISTSASYNKLFRCFGGTHVFEYAPLTSNYCAPLNVLNGLTD